MDAEVLIQAAKAVEASIDADREQEAFFYGQSTETAVALALSKAHVEAMRAMEAFARRVAELERSALQLQGGKAA